MKVVVKNPHSVLAALEKRPQDILRVYASQGPQEAWNKVIQLAKQNRISVASTDHSPHKLRESHVELEEKEEVTLKEIFEGAKTRHQGKGLWIACDCLQDPHNVGAIFRSAAFFGVQGILLTEERSAPLTGTVYDIACGGVETVPFIKVVNLKQALDEAKKQGLWVMGTSEHAQENFFNQKPDRPWLLVIGNEEKGLRKLTLEHCDLVCAIPPHKNISGEVTSLNVSVATGIMISRLT
jgi:23S rRNA (guanosine2251-2'-O)-methyltransferase